MTAHEQIFGALLSVAGITVTEEQWAQFDAYYRLLIDWNERMNLTAIVDRAEVYEKHFYDSVTLVKATTFGPKMQCLDIGSGAGFPAIPLAILFPNVHMTMIESSGKRVSFLKVACQTLQLARCTLVHGRAEEVAHVQELRESFDMVTARAVAKMPYLVECGLPFVRVGGDFVAMKGADGVVEMHQAQRAIAYCGGGVARNIAFLLPFSQAMRQLIVVPKVQQTPKQYPRTQALLKKNPL
jgi:16S rRNA (guanine527-N7)-methyltransferase